MSERHVSRIVVDLLLERRNSTTGKTEILMMLAEYLDNQYDLPGGHLEPGEDLYDAMIRETEEELCIKLKRKDLKMIHLLHHYHGERLNFIFETDGEELNPQIGEPHKCSELKWVPIKKLPKNTTAKVKQMIKNIIKNNFYDTL